MNARGFSLVEALIGLVLLTVALTALGSLLTQSSRINRRQQAQTDLQSSARNTLTVVVQTLRTAGWNPRNVAMVPVVADPSSVVTGDSIQVRADINADGDTADDFEDVVIRHVDDRIEWKRSAAATTFEILGVDLTNDADGDGTAEPMFTLSGSPVNRIKVTITGRGSRPEAWSGKVARYTVSSDVTLRSQL